MGKQFAEILAYVMGSLMILVVLLVLGSGVLALGKLFLYLLGGF